MLILHHLPVAIERSNVKRLVRRILPFSVGALVVVVLATFGVSPAQAVDWNRPSKEYSSNGSWIPIRPCPTTNCNPTGWVKSGSTFYMDCYTDFQWSYGNYWSNRWFYGYNGYWGYVHSSYVYNQISVPRC